MAGDMCSLYNEAVEDVPHCYPVDVDRFTSEICSGKGDKMHSQVVFLARAGGRFLGFAHCALEKRKKGGDQGALRFYWYRPGFRKVGQELLDNVDEYFSCHGVQRVVAFHFRYRYPFYCFKHAYLSSLLGHVEAILGVNGYRRYKGEVFMDWRNFTPVSPGTTDVDHDIELEWKPGRGVRPGLVVRAMSKGEEIGKCSCISCGEFSDSEILQGWFFTEWIGVNDEYQGRGLGRCLLSTALNEMHGAGYNTASISTDSKNYRAFLFYTNMGYKVVDWTYCYSREIINSG